MQGRGITPDVYSYNGLMQARVASGAWAEALDVSTACCDTRT